MGMRDLNSGSFWYAPSYPASPPRGDRQGSLVCEVWDTSQRGVHVAVPELQLQVSLSLGSHPLTVRYHDNDGENQGALI